ncbi:hypothetical protein B0A67_24500 [Flavobacterium aquidurense]|uniref:DUF5712 family protein n=1 Tax=Flavobacterium aquidurense TaxID=362413 RepID=UPI00091B9245|nr:DUF5712 family protein [Flavobacterium aquidurense]OXA65331.1 hypothetical protein B0A67_24500 [Flavobacterium aquidurense]SHH86799.1 hypothetical protein SAMN05444481_13619 [Flavobacterium frigidimaris]
MHVSFTAHDAKSSTSSSNLIEYLDKENQLNNINNEVNNYENYFDTNYDSVNSNQKIDAQDIINNLDSNRGSQKLSSSNFYMINISPSKYELQHMEKIAEKELNSRGIYDNKNEASKLYYNEQKDELMKMQLKLYTKDVMTSYAENFNRDIYVNESKLPNDLEKKSLNLETEKAFKEFLKEKNINLSSDNDKENVKSKEWISLNNVAIKSESDKSYCIEIDLKEKGKAEVFVPKSTLQVQKDGTYKLPKSLYEEKEKEVISKNKLVEIQCDSINKKTININKNPTKIIEFNKKDNRFKDRLSFAIDEKDLKIKDGNYYVSEHLLKEKESYAIQNAVTKEFQNEKENIYNKLATEKGFDMTKRPLTEKDLMWYGKVETSRTYKHNDKIILENQRNQKEHKGNLHRNSKGEIIKVGDVKEGNQYHVHVVVSRHDKTMENPRNKISLSPLANQKENNMNNGAKVGFDRNNFIQKTETIFDSKFNYNRPLDKSYESYKNQSKSSTSQAIENKVTNKGKQLIMKHAGINEAKRIINPIADIKKELGIANIPSRLPTSIKDLALKVTKKILSQGIDIG